MEDAAYIYVLRRAYRYFFSTTPFLKQLSSHDRNSGWQYFGERGDYRNRWARACVMQSLPVACDLLCVPPPLPAWSDLTFTCALVLCSHAAAQCP